MSDKLIPVMIYRARAISSKDDMLNNMVLTRYQMLGAICVNVPYDRVASRAQRDSQAWMYTKVGYMLSFVLGAVLLYIGIYSDAHTQRTELSGTGMVGILVLMVDFLVLLMIFASNKGHSDPANLPPGALTSELVKRNGAGAVSVGAGTYMEQSDLALGSASLEFQRSSDQDLPRTELAISTALEMQRENEKLDPGHRSILLLSANRYPIFLKHCAETEALLQSDAPHGRTRLGLPRG
jgi:hypothetical protein